MKVINREVFFNKYREQFGPLKQGQVDGLSALLSALEADPYVVDIRWGVYMLATTKWETGDTFQPIHEYGTKAYFEKRYGSDTKVGHVLGNTDPGDGAAYAGRGDVQLTGENNYEMAEKALRKDYPAVVASYEARTGKKFDITVGDGGNPDEMMDATLAYCIMSYGMRKGAFTGVGLQKYINADNCNYHDARKIINGTDQADKIAGFAIKLETVLLAATV